MATCRAAVRRRLLGATNRACEAPGRHAPPVGSFRHPFQGVAAEHSFVVRRFVAVQGEPGSVKPSAARSFADRSGSSGRITVKPASANS